MPKTADIGLRIGLIFCIIFTITTLALATLETIPEAQAAGGTRATLAVTQITRSGVARTLATADGDGYKFSNNGYVFLEIANAYTATITATFVTPGTVDGLAIADLDVALTAGQTKLIGPFPPSQYNQPSGTDIGTVYLNWNAAVTGTVANSVTLAAYRIDQ